MYYMLYSCLKMKIIWGAFVMQKFLSIIFSSLLLISCGGAATDNDSVDDDSDTLTWNQGNWDERKWK